MKQFIFLLMLGSSVTLNSQNTTCKCCTENYKAFDFWLGDWTVFKTDGSLAGTNTIDKIQGNCVVRENWKSAQGAYTGTSSNFYNTQTGEWEQVLIDNQGGSLHLKGHRVGNQMILKSDTLKDQDGVPYFHQITWTKNEDGTVRQYWETFKNKDTIVAFDGLYKKTR